MGSAFATAAGIVFVIVCFAEGFGALADWETEGAAPIHSEGLPGATGLGFPGLGKQEKPSTCMKHTHTQAFVYRMHASMTFMHV